MAHKLIRYKSADFTHLILIDLETGNWDSCFARHEGDRRHLRQLRGNIHNRSLDAPYPHERAILTEMGVNRG